MTQAVATQSNETKLPVAQTESQGGQILNTDLVVPRVYLLQQLSELVTAPEASHKAGQIVRSTSGEVLGDQKKALEIIPLFFTNQWQHTEKVGNKYEWRSTEERHPGNENHPWEYTKNGTAWKRTKVMSLFALLKSDLEAYEKAKKEGTLDLDSVILPVVIQFRSTSYAAGKDVVTFFKKAAMLRETEGADCQAYHYALPLLAKYVEKKGNKWFIYQVGKSTRVKPEYAATAAKWASDLSKMSNIQVDMTGDEDEGEPVPGEIC